MQILPFTPAPGTQAEHAFFNLVDMALLTRQRRWLNQTLREQAPQDRPGRRLLRLIDSLGRVFQAQGTAADQRKRYWRAVHESKAWLLQQLDGGDQEENPGTGLLHLLDGIQDFATDSLHLPEEWVFPGLRFTRRQQQEACHTTAENQHL